MKSINKKILILLCILLLIPIIKNRIDYYTVYNTLSEETKQWAKWYCSLSTDDRLAISYYPSELYELEEKGFNICK